MLITNNINSYNYNCKSANTSFKGHAGCDIIRNFGHTERLTTETAFFRESKTLNFAVKYINEVFKDIKEKKFLVGGCSSGEEVWSLKMLMEDNPVKITGFDLSPKSIKEAKRGIYELSRPKNKESEDYIKDFGASAYNDYFLGFEKANLSEEEKREKRLFHKMFTKSNAGETLILSINRRLREIMDIGCIEFERLKFKIKNPQQKDCSFISGDIRDVDKINNGAPVQLVSFRNALYHITTDNNDSTRYRYYDGDIKPELNLIFRKINNVLMKKGLLILGEKEHKQGGNMNLVCRCLLENGFIPVRSKAELPYYNIWIKVKDAG